MKHWNWNAVDTVLFDLDGTLLDLHFDNHFWMVHVPLRYAEARGMELNRATAEIAGMIEALRGTLRWYCLEHWTEATGLDMVALKAEVQHKIRVRPHALAALDHARGQGKRLILATNAHRGGLDLKLRATGLTPYFDAIVSSHDYGAPKEAAEFWERLTAAQALELPRCVLFDDNQAVLAAARSHGVGHTVWIRQPDLSRPPEPAGDSSSMVDFDEILPSPGGNL